MSVWIQVPAEQIRKEREKARKLRQSQWWRQQIGRGLCFHCGKKFEKADLTMDHLLPLARGGKSTKKKCGCELQDVQHAERRSDTR